MNNRVGAVNDYSNNSLPPIYNQYSQRMFFIPEENVEQEINTETKKEENQEVKSEEAVDIEPNLQQILPEGPIEQEKQVIQTQKNEYKKFPMTEDLYSLMVYIMIKRAAVNHLPDDPLSQINLSSKPIWKILFRKLRCQTVQPVESLLIMFLFTATTQEICLGVMLGDLLNNASYFQFSRPNLYVALRFVLILFSYYLFCKDYKGINEYLILRKRIPEINSFSPFALFCVFRLAFTILNEFVVIYVILSSNLGEDSGIGMITNFSAALIVSQIDDLMMETAVVNEVKQLFSNIPEYVLNEQQSQQPTNLEDQSEQRLLEEQNIKSEPIAADQEKQSPQAQPETKEPEKQLKQVDTVYKHAGFLQVYIDKDNSMISTLMSIRNYNLTIFTLHKFFILVAIVYNAYSHFSSPKYIGGVSFGYPLSTSSSLSDFDQSFARLNSSSGWCPSSDNNKLDDYWIQVLSPQDELWVKWSIQGKADQDYWVTTYMIQYSQDGKEWENVTETPLDGNTDRNTVVNYTIQPDGSDFYVLAKAIKIVPLTWNGQPCLRFEAYHLTS